MDLSILISTFELIINLKNKIMTGTILILTIVLIIVGYILGKNYETEEGGTILKVIGIILFVALIVAIPVSRMDSKANVESIKQFQIVLTESRALEKSSELERIKVIEKIDNYNRKIANWKTKGQHWYNNKWYYTKECQNVDYLK